MEKPAQLFDVRIVCALYEEAEAVLNEFSTRCHVSFSKEFSGLDRYEYRYTSIPNNRGELLTVLITWLSDSGPTQTGLDLKPFLRESEGVSRDLQEMKAASSTSQVLHYTRGFDGWKEPVKKMKSDRLKRELKEIEEPRCVI